jgi:hypothetical protein
MDTRLSDDIVEQWADGDGWAKNHPLVQKMALEIVEHRKLTREAANPDINKRLLKLELAVSTLMPDKSHDI